MVTMSSITMTVAPARPAGSDTQSSPMHVEPTLGAAREPCRASRVAGTATSPPSGHVAAAEKMDEVYFTPLEVAERLKENEDTVRKPFLNEPGVLTICFPRKGRRLYRTLRIPESVFSRVVMRLTRQDRTPRFPREAHARWGQRTMLHLRRALSPVLHVRESYRT
jgi:hypothetical protein